MSKQKKKLMVLVWESRTGFEVFGGEERYLKMFYALNSAGYYPEREDEHEAFYRLAIAGDKEAAETFLRLRLQYEYEGFQECEVH